MNLKDAIDTLKGIWGIAKDVADPVKKWSAKTWTLAMLIVLVLLVGGAIGGYYWKGSRRAELQELTQKAHDDQVSSLKEQIGSKEEQIRSKEAVIAAKDNELNIKDGQIDRLSTEVAASETRAGAAGTAVATRDAGIADLNNRVTMLSTRLSELQLISTPTVAPTSTPAPLPTPSSASIPDSTSVITLTTAVAPDSTQSSLPPIGSTCDASLLEIVERANSSWIGFVQGTTTQAELEAVWGEASQGALDKVDEFRRNLKVWNASLVDLKYELRGCKVINQIGDKKVVIETYETWEYSASLTCSNGKIMDKLVEDYPQQNYRLLHDSDGWRLFSWETGDRTVIDGWQCKR